MSVFHQLSAGNTWQPPTTGGAAVAARAIDCGKISEKLCIVEPVDVPAAPHALSRLETRNSVRSCRMVGPSLARGFAQARGRFFSATRSLGCFGYWEIIQFMRLINARLSRAL